MKTLTGKIAVAAGAARGAGCGIALVLGEQGATVYVAGRTARDVERTAAQVTARGGCGIPAQADLSDPGQGAGLFKRIAMEHGRLDLLVNSVWAANTLAAWGTPFWELSEGLWRDTLAAVHAYWFASARAMPLLRRGGLIVHVTDNHYPEPSAWRGQMLFDLGHEVAIVGLNPGFMRTEAVLAHMNNDAAKRQFRFDLSESPEYIGRAVAALAADAAVLKKTGHFLWVADLAREYGFTDVDGRYIPRFDPTAPEQEFPC